MSVLTAEVAQIAGELSSSPLAPFCASLELVEAIVLSSGDPMENLVGCSSSPAAMKDED